MTFDITVNANIKIGINCNVNKTEAPYYQIRELTLETRGQYYCVAINSLGNKTSNKAYVKIKGDLYYNLSDLS